MLLADTNVFIDFLRKRSEDNELAESLAAGEAVLHPFVEGELYLSGIPSEVKNLLSYIPRADIVDHGILLRFIGRYGDKIRGVGYVDLHLLLSAAQMGARFVTRDKSLAELVRAIPGS